MTTLTIIYSNPENETEVTITRNISRDCGFDEIYEALYNSALALGYSPETVREFMPEPGEEWEKIKYNIPEEDD